MWGWGKTKTPTIKRKTPISHHHHLLCHKPTVDVLGNKLSIQPYDSRAKHHFKTHHTHNERLRHFKPACAITIRKMITPLSSPSPPMEMRAFRYCGRSMWTRGPLVHAVSCAKKGSGAPGMLCTSWSMIYILCVFACHNYVAVVRWKCHQFTFILICPGFCHKFFWVGYDSSC